MNGDFFKLLGLISQSSLIGNLQQQQMMFLGENERDFEEEEDEDDRALSGMIEHNHEENSDMDLQAGPEITKLNTLNKFLGEEELASTDKIYLIYEKLLEEVFRQYYPFNFVLVE